MLEVNQEAVLLALCSKTFTSQVIIFRCATLVNILSLVVFVFEKESYCGLVSLNMVFSFILSAIMNIFGSV